MARRPDGRMVVIDLERSHRDFTRMCSRLEIATEALPPAALAPEHIEMVREAMERRGFDIVLWLPGRHVLPKTGEMLRRSTSGPDHLPPEFYGSASERIVADIRDERPDGPYILLTSGKTSPEQWTRGKSAEALRGLLTRLGERGLTLHEYLMLEQLHGAGRQRETKERMDESVGTLLLDATLPDGQVLAVTNSPGGRLSLSSAQPDIGHPQYGSRTAMIIPLE